MSIGSTEIVDGCTLTDEQVEQLTTILREAPNMLWSATVMSNAVRKYMNMDGVRSWIMLMDGQVVGAAFGETHAAAALQGIIEMQYVIAAEHRNKGLGSILVEHTVGALRRDFHRIYLHVTTDNFPAIRLYLKAGFKFESREVGGYFGKDQYIMAITCRDAE